MKRLLLLVLGIWSLGVTGLAQQPKFRVLAFYSEKVERDHVDFTHDAIRFYTAASERDHFAFTATTNWEDLNSTNLEQYDIPPISSSMTLWCGSTIFRTHQLNGLLLNSTSRTVADGWDFMLQPITIVGRSGRGSCRF